MIATPPILAEPVQLILADTPELHEGEPAQAWTWCDCASAPEPQQTKGHEQ